MAFYPKDEVDQTVDQILGLLEQSLALNKSAALDQAELADLRAKQATSAKVVLQKVAAAPALDSNLIDTTLQCLVDTSFLSRENREKMAAELQKDPNAALKLASRIATLSTPGHEGGHGVKTASATTTPTTSGEWDKVLEEGA